MARMYTTDEAVKDLSKHRSKTMVIHIDGRTYEITGIGAVDDDEVEFTFVEGEPDDDS